MDPELRCPTCSRYFLSPILMPCGHSLCTSCAVNALRPVSDATVSAAVQAVISANEASNASQKRPSTAFEAIIHNEPNLEGSSSTVSGASHGGTDSDQQSIVSEADSGVVMASRVGIYASRLPTIICPNLLGFIQVTHPSTVSQQVIQSLTNGLACPLCHRIVALMDEKGINHLPRNRALERVLVKLVGEEAVTNPLRLDNPARQGVPICQLCDEPDPLNMDPLSIGGARISESGSQGGTAATVWCEQCSIFYCEECRERCHPKRGPLLKHGLHPASTGAEIVRQKRQNQPSMCSEHPHEPASLFCIACRVAICNECVLPDTIQTTCIRTPNSYGRHAHQEVQILQNYCKNKKTELSQVLQALSEKARAGTQHIQQLRTISETVLKSAKRAEEDATVKFDCLIQTIEAKKGELISAIKEERDRKLGALKEQIHQCTSKLTRSTGLIQFCIEMLKENDAFSFLLVSQSLINRALHTEQSFLHAIETPPAVVQFCPRAQPPTTSGQSHPSTPAHWVKSRSAHLAHSSFVSLMQLDAIHKVISDLTLHEGIDDQLIDCSASSASSDCEVPNAPVFRAEECLSEGNIITLVWQPCPGFGIDYYTLEIDDGAGGAFRVRSLSSS
uniref:E3 ubiquitin protein ligase TRIM9 n=1 Tax=Echinococcus granulosus TaxID=6210 RepID=A0A068WNA5_ECHGR|nr:E3 ubiquitin protein ligase TRIM9 [Echinococcus granulosus]